MIRQEVLQRVADAVAARAAALDRPVVVAIDGGSGAGKSTLAAALAKHLDAALVSLDDFYQTTIPEAELPNLLVEQRLHAVFEWPRVRRDVLLPLRDGEAARWCAFDFLAGIGPRGTYELQDEKSVAQPRPVVVLEGSYSCSPPLADLIDVKVLVQLAEAERRRRVDGRGDNAHLDLDVWRQVWPPVEEHYFSKVCPPESFDVIVENDGAVADA